MSQKDEGLMEKNYLDATIDEYFEILDRENQRRSKLVAKSLVKYLQNANQEEDKSKTIKEQVG
jgi:hypothetical protein